MSSIELLQRRIHTAKNLQSMVKMMKVLASLNIHQYEQAVASLAEYSHTIEMGLHVVLKAAHNHDALPLELSRDLFQTESRSLATDDIDRCGALIFGSDQGMCGQFNEQISRYAIAELEKLQISPAKLTIFTVGSRVIPHLESAGYPIAQTFTMPDSLSGITPMVQAVLLQIATWRDRQQIDQIHLFYNHLQSNTLSAPSQLKLLPLDRQWLQHIDSQSWRSRTLPSFTMPSDILVASLLQQYFFIALYRAFGESLAGENSSRLASMQIAEKNIDERLTEFTSQFQQERQTAITEELLEVITTFELNH